MAEGEIMVFAKEYADKIIKHKMAVHDTFNKEQAFAELSQAFIEGADFMYYSNNEELKKELTEKDKQIAKMKCCAICEFQYVRSIAAVIDDESDEPCCSCKEHSNWKLRS